MTFKNSSQPILWFHDHLMPEQNAREVKGANPIDSFCAFGLNLISTAL